MLLLALKIMPFLKEFWLYTRGCWAGTKAGAAGIMCPEFDGGLFSIPRPAAPFVDRPTIEVSPSDGKSPLS